MITLKTKEVFMSETTPPVPAYTAGQKVNLVILRRTDLGFVAKINDQDEGLLYHNEIFEHLDPDQKLPGYIKKVREDGRIDLQLHAFGNFGAEDIGKQILQTLDEHHGFLPVNDKTPAEKIYELFGVSKKKYKIALGGLYKKRLILISDEGIRWNPEAFQK
jgi:predicted RNA-binding protein (virulence factor B family)